MTTVDPAAIEVAPPAGRAIRFWRRCDALLERAGDRLNPILVKETRQALKSRQFTLTFVLVLAACWVWTIFGVAMIGPGIEYTTAGVDMFYGYYVILIAPLAVIVPYTAYRSLSAEREDNTYELLSISTLTPRQIISGKLGSALLQIIVFFSATAPCLAFTYLLRGIDIVTIGVLLFYAFFGSLGLSMIGLLLATATREKYGQVLMNVVLTIGLVYVFSMGAVGAGLMVAERAAIFGGAEFWIVNGVLLTIYVTYFAMFFLAASAQITFASENRSTSLRVVMLIQHACLMGWVTWGWIYMNGDAGNAVPLSVIALLHWGIMGIFMVGESPHLSSRVKRSLPQSIVGRMCLTWFNPGPGTGYVFATCGMLATLAMVLLALAIASLAGYRTGRWMSWEMAIAFAAVCTAYVMIYLGLAKLILDGLRKIVAFNPAVSPVVNVLLVGAGTGIPLTIQMMSPTLRRSGYTMLQITNPFWTLVELGDGPTAATIVAPVTLVLSIAAVVVFALNLPGIVRELRHVRIAKPARVAEEDAALQPPPEPVRTSPWD